MSEAARNGVWIDLIRLCLNAGTGKGHLPLSLLAPE